MGSHQSPTMKIPDAALLLLLLLLLLAPAASIATITEAPAPSPFSAEQSPEPSENVPAVQQALEAIAAAATKAKEAERLAWQLHAEPGTDGDLADCLSACAEMYSMTYDSLQTAEQILKGIADPDSELMVELTAAADGVMSCSDGFDERPEMESPFIDINGELISLVHDCLTFGMSLLQ